MPSRLLTLHRSPALRQAFVLMLLNTAVRALGAIAALVLAYSQGTGPQMDRYMAFTLSVVGFCTLVGASIPSLVGRELTGGFALDPQRALKLRSWGRLLSWLGGLTYLVSAPMLAWLFTPANSNGFWQLLALLVTGLPIVAAAPAVAVEQALIQSRGHVYSATVAMTLCTGTTLAFTVVATALSEIRWCAAGMVVGALWEYLQVRRLNARLEQCWPKATWSLDLSEFPCRAFFIFTGASLGSFAIGFIDQALLARVGEGAQALWGLAGRAPSFLTMSLFAVVSILTTQSVAQTAEGDLHGLRRRTQQLALGSLTGSAALMSLLWLAAHPLTALLYERGAFTPADTERTAEVLRLTVWTYVLYPLSVVLVRAVSSTSGYRPLLASAAMFFMAKLALGGWAQTHFGLAGVALSTFFAMAVQCVVLAAALFPLRGTTAQD